MEQKNEEKYALSLSLSLYIYIYIYIYREREREMIPMNNFTFYPVVTLSLKLANDARALPSRDPLTIMSYFVRII